MREARRPPDNQSGGSAMQYTSSQFSRRRFLSLGLAAGAAAAVGVSFRPRLAAASVAQPSLNIHLAWDASPQFRAVTDLVAKALERTSTPGAALAIFANDREEIATFGVADLA